MSAEDADGRGQGIRVVVKDGLGQENDRVVRVAEDDALAKSLMNVKVSEVAASVAEDHGFLREQWVPEIVDVPAAAEAKTRPLEPTLGARIDQKISEVCVDRVVKIDGFGGMSDPLGKSRSELPLQI